MEMIDKFAEMVQKDIDKRLDDEIRNIFGIRETFKQKTSEDVISDFNRMIDKMTTLIICSPENKKKLEEQELPPMTKIIPNSFMEDDKAYVITDDKLKSSILEGMRLNKKFYPDKE